MASVAPDTPVADLGTYGPDGRSAWLDVDWRTVQRWILVDGEPLNIVDLDPPEGAAGGVPLLFVHGLSGCWQNWLENLPFFAAGGHRVIAMDLPGFGATPLGEQPITIPAYAQTLVALMDVLKIPRACVVGNSMGGFVALELAQTAPDRVASLVLVSPVGINTRAQRHDRALAALRRAERLLTAAGGQLALRADAVARRARLRRATMRLAVHRPERLPVALMSEQIRQGSGKAGFVAALDALTDHDVEERLGTIDCPVLVYWGREDRLVPVRDAEKLVAGIPGARSVILPETGHMAMLERPARFNADVAAFLAG